MTDQEKTLMRCTKKELVDMLINNTKRIQESHMKTIQGRDNEIQQLRKAIRIAHTYEYRYSEALRIIASIGLHNNSYKREFVECIKTLASTTLSVYNNPNDIRPDSRFEMMCKHQPEEE
jgi:hypothetical protein